MGRNWSTKTVLLSVFYVAVMYYVFVLSPDLNPSRDLYFFQKLFYLKVGDGFQMNKVFVALSNIIAVWTALYSTLLVPTARSSNKVPVWPFLVLSFFLGAYALIPYFVLLSPPAPPVEKEEIRKWPLNFLESKVFAVVVFAAGLGLLAYAGLSTREVWTDFFQLFKESRLVHGTTIDFVLLCACSPFWVYNDMAARKCITKGSWLFPIFLVPVLGPALYAILRPSLSLLAKTSRSKRD